MAEHDSTIPVTMLLHEASGGNREALNALFPLIYDELKAVAGARLQMERAGHTLNATALVSEAYIKLVDQNRVDWQTRGHFFSVAALAMRRILADYAEARNAQKRGGDREHVSLDALGDVLSDDQARDFLALNRAIDKLGEFNPRGRDVIQYRFFCGLSYDEIAEVMGLAAITVRRSWMVARAWLRRELGEGAVDSATHVLGVAGLKK
jgi:RNA polymerase sigma factor (TIGR02999 family)